MIARPLRFSNYNILKELTTRVFPIIMLIIANIALIFIVKNSRNRMKNKSRPIQAIQASQPAGASCLASVRALFASSSEAAPPPARHASTASATQPAAAHPKPAKSHAANKRSRQDNQLTLMTICVALLYIACSVPMCLIILLPGLVWQTNVTNTNEYKHFAAICNSLELIQCLVRFFIYYFFTTQFRLELHQRYLCWPRSQPTLARAANEHLALLNIRAASQDQNEAKAEEL